MSEDREQRIDRIIAMSEERLSKAGAILPSVQTTGGASTITINAGGIGVWVSVTCCVVMLASNIFLAALFIDQQQHLRDVDAYLAYIYQTAPYLKPPPSN